MKTTCFYQWYFFISTAAKKPKLLFVAFCTYWFQWTKKSLQKSFSHFPGFPEAGGTFSLQSQKLLHHFIFISLQMFQLWKVHTTIRVFFAWNYFAVNLKTTSKLSKTFTSYQPRLPLIQVEVFNSCTKFNCHYEYSYSTGTSNQETCQHI